MTINQFSHLSHDHYDDLKKSGLSDGMIIGAGFKSIPPRDIRDELGISYTADIKSIFGIPYPQTDGYTRYRIFYQNGIKHTKKHPKYRCKPGTGNRLYIPDSVRSVLNDPSVPLYITEGEKKALKACQEVLHCIGLSGLWNWSDGNKELIKDFDLINFTGRTVYIVPDSDWLLPNIHGYEKNLKQAVWELSKKLQERGAIVKIVQLPKE